MSQDNARSFARLPEIVESAQQLIIGSLNAELRRVREATENGNDEKSALPLDRALRVADTMRALIAETTKFLGIRVDVQHTVSGTIRHEAPAPSEHDLDTFLSGLVDANLLDKRHAIEVGP